ncbi:MAG: DUF6263 family protein [Crocinitomicaceae bacterium]
MKKIGIILLVGILISCNKEKVKLGIEMSVGDKHATEASITIGSMGQLGRMKFLVDDEVVAVDEAGNHQMNFYYRKMEMEMGSMRYDSDYPEATQFSRLLHTQLGFLFNQPIKGIVKRNGATRITEDFKKWEGYANMDPKVAKSLEESFSHRNIVLPADEIQEGDSWNAEMDRESNGMLMHMKMTYTLKSVSSEEIKITLKGEMSTKSGMSATGTIEGEMVLDGKSHYTKSVKMDFLMKAQGQTIPMNVLMSTTKIKD